MSYTFNGQVVHVSQTQNIKDTFRKRDIVLRLDGQYPQEVKFQVTQDRCTLLDSIKPGMTVTAHFNVRGRSYQTKDGGKDWFTTLEIWKIEGVQQGSPAQDYSGVKPAGSTGATADFDDVPF